MQLLADEERSSWSLPEQASGLVLPVFFIEAHPSPDSAKCDGPSALPLEKIGTILRHLKQLDDLVKSFDPIEIV